MAKQYSERGREIGARIAGARKEVGGMTQEELADLIGVSPRSIQAYESGEVIPYRYLRDLERVLGRDAAWLLHGDEILKVKDDQFAEVLTRLETIEGLLRAGPQGSES